MENHETSVGAALRETWEEANAEVEEARLFALYSLPHISQVYIMYRGRLKQGRASPGAETLEVKLFSQANIPWMELAFPVVRESLELYYEDCSKGEFSTHIGDIFRGPDQRFKINRY
jgi:ADP-ribose pyrophosphatase YjhB (NUDIX family)